MNAKGRYNNHRGFKKQQPRFQNNNFNKNIQEDKKKIAGTNSKTYPQIQKPSNCVQSNVNSFFPKGSLYELKKRANQQKIIKEQQLNASNNNIANPNLFNALVSEINYQPNKAINANSSQTSFQKNLMSTAKSHMATNSNTNTENKNLGENQLNDLLTNNFSNKMSHTNLPITQNTNIQNVDSVQKQRTNVQNCDS